MKLNTVRRGTAAAAVLALSVSLAACSSEDDSTEGSGTEESSSAPAEETPSEEAPEESESAPADDAAAAVFGPACDQVPADGAGSFNGMVTEPVATAASANPLLQTLVTAVGSVEGLADTLNTQEALTVFAPFEGAFAEIPEADLNGLIEGATADGMNSDLAKILSHHVLPANNDAAAVVGEQETLNGDTLTIEGDESGMTVSDGTVTANVLCGNIPTANATVYVIDKVLTGIGS
ncbi:fasciclin domain-containing protein [Nocardioides nanhaiensis]|uniref:FAS1 domain-containing protein n=1 Tax=Nocardioides nanhaiensis TaxID=1476871 RepID=A0ABP8VS61_9ACTN